MKNLSLNHSSYGEGEPVLIIHGLFGSSRNWKSLARQFAENFKVILIDLRNHGDSPFDDAMSYDDMVSDVVSLLDQLKILSTIIIGHSMGGKVAMKLCHLYPERVKKLIIADIAPISYTHNYDDILGPVLNLDLRNIGSRQDADKQLEAAIPDQRVRLFLLQNLALQQGKASWKLNWLALKENMSLLTGYEDISHWTISTPSLFIRGELSDYVSDQTWEIIGHYFLNAELATLENAGHWLHAEQPASFFNTVVKFIQNKTH